MTSRDAVNRVQRVVRKSVGRDAKVGHAGTLDPIATGVLVVCVGPATRLIEYVQRMPKQYRGTFLLGRRSPSDDVELEAELLDDPPLPTCEQIVAALPAFTGEIEQIPPAYSAIKIDGQKAYNLARRGDAVVMKPRPVTIYSLAVHRYEYPELVLDIRCGSGTYIRSLGRDLAESLGTAAVMSDLVRTAIGEFRVESAILPPDWSATDLGEALLPPSLAVARLPRRELGAGDLDAVQHGRPIAPHGLAGDSEAALFDASGRLIALGGIKRGMLWPLRVFSAKT